MTLAESITSRYATPTARILYRRKGETRTRDVTNNVPNISGAITGGQNFGQAVAGWSVTFRNLPFEPVIKDQVEIHLGWDNQNVSQFVGFVTDPGRQSFPRGRTVQLRDLAWVADFPVEQTAGEVVYDPDTGDPLTVQSEGIVLLGPGGTPNDIPAREAAIRLLRDWGGIPEDRIRLPVLEVAPGIEWILGRLSPLAWSGSSPIQIVQQIYDTLGYWVYVDGAGYVQAIKISGKPTGSAWKIYEEGVNLPVSGPTSGGSVDTVYNRVVVTGATTLLVPSVTGQGPAAVFPVTDSWRTNIGTLPAGKNRTLGYNNDFIEYTTIAEGGDASCEAVAKRLIEQHSREPFVIAIPNAKGDPRLRTGQTVGIIAPRLGVPAQRNFFVYSVQTTFGGGVYSQSITLDGGAGPQGYDEADEELLDYADGVQPSATFTWTLLRETMGGVDTVEIFLVGNELSVGGGPLASWEWSCPDGTPTTGTGRLWMTRVPMSEASAVVTLVVRDAENIASEPFAQTITFADADGLPERQIALAAGNTWYATPDGGRTWNQASVPGTIAVPPIGAGGDDMASATAATAGAVAARTNGVQSTLDMLETAPIARAALPATPTFLWQHEREPNRVWAAVDDSIYFSADAGSTFDLVGVSPVPANEADRSIRWIVEGFDRFNVVDVLAGRYSFISFDGAKTWTQQVVGPPESIAKTYVSGFDRHWVGFANVTDGSSPVRSFEGQEVTFPAGATPPVTSVNAITMMVDTPELFMFDAEGRIWRADVATGGNVTLWGTMPE